MARSALKFRIRIDLPGQSAGDDASFISYEQMMNTIDKAYDQGKYDGAIEQANRIAELGRTLELEDEAGRLLSMAADEPGFPRRPT